MRSKIIILSLLLIVLSVTSVNAKTLLTTDEMKTIKGKGCDLCAKSIDNCNQTCRGWWNSAESSWAYYNCSGGTGLDTVCINAGDDGPTSYCNAAGTPYYCTDNLLYGNPNCSGTGSSLPVGCSLPNAVSWNSDCPGSIGVE